MDDPSHPIPYVFNCDVNGVKISGGADLIVVVASPLAGDERSLNRLMKKLEMYIRFISSNEFRAESGAPTTANTHIKVKLHLESSSVARELLFRCNDWVRAINATLEVENLE
jgi:hypothetical protein